MHRELGENYQSVRSFGNKNYKQYNKPIELADPDTGVEIVREILDGGKSVILVCYEEAPTACHRSIVATLLSETLGYPVEHLLRSEISKGE